MPTGTKSDFVIYDPRIRGGYVETLVENTDAFNAISNGTIKFSTNQQAGDFDYNAMFKNIGDTVTRRDTASLAAVADKKLTQDEFIGVKINRKIGPIAQTLDGFRKAGESFNEDTFHYSVGQNVAKDAAKDYLTTALRGTRAMLVTKASNLQDITGDTVKTLKSKDLINALAKYGDASDRILAWVMHSTAFFELVGDQYDFKLTGISNLIIATGSPLTINRPVLVVDNDALKDVDGGGVGLDHYFSMGLTAGAVEIEDSESEIIKTEVQLGLENIVMRLQGEFAYNMRVKGCKWDVTNGGENPDDTAIATGTNWDSVLASHKDFAGVVIQSQTAS